MPSLLESKSRLHGKIIHTQSSVEFLGTVKFRSYQIIGLVWNPEGCDPPSLAAPHCGASQNCAAALVVNNNTIEYIV